MKRQQFSDTPAMSGDSGCHRGRALDTRPTGCRRRPSHALMRRAEVIDGPKQIPALRQRAGLPRQRSAPAGQRGESLTKRRVEARDGGGGDHPVALGAVPSHLHPCGRPLHDAALDRDHAPLLVPLDDLRDEDLGPRSELGTAALAAIDRLAERLAHGTYVGTPALGTTPDGVLEGTRRAPARAGVGSGAGHGVH
jgi:hypothetical protein